MPEITPESLSGLGRPLVALTAYSYPFGRLLDEAGVDLILVGDSLGMVEHGRPDTVSTTLDEMVAHVRSVRPGVQRALLAADLPADTYKTPAEAVASARCLQNAGAEMIKLEGGREILPALVAMREAGFHLLGHLGMLPQRIREEGRYRIKGRSPEEQTALLADALALQEAGVAAIVLELVNPPVAAEITRTLSIPTIGIGSGPDCGGQILVTYDLIGLSPWFRPGFVEPAADVGRTIQEAVRKFAARVRSQA